jgi:apolipoprotein N-acyltransferase
MHDAPRLRVGIVQPNMEAFSKWTHVREGQRRLVEGTRQLERSVHPDLVVWPENAYARGLPVEIARVPGAVTGGAQTPILLGTVGRLGRNSGFNRVVLVDERGDVQGTYDKVNLLAFGEYLPFEHRFPWLRALSPTSGRVHPGHHVQPLPFRGWRISALVCYEDTLPEFVRRVVREGAPHLLVNLTNDAWFGDTQEPWIHLALAKLRAIEQRRYLVRATNTGVSGVIDPGGRVIARSGAFTQETLSAEVAMLAGGTPYQALGDWPGWLSLATILWLAFGRRRPGVAAGRDRPPPR